MTMFRRLARAMKVRTGLDSNFEHYYSTLLTNTDGAGVPSAREAQQDLRAARLAQNVYYGRV